MSRDHNVPLLKEMDQIEPRHPQSTLTNELTHELNEARHKPLVPSQRALVVHYWSPTGQHSMYSVTANMSKSVKDVISSALEHFAIADDAGLYQLKFANKKGEAKVDLPPLDPGHAIVDTGFVRFCLRKRGQPAAELSEITDQTAIPEIDTTEATLPGMEQKQQEPDRVSRKSNTKRSWLCMCCSCFEASD
mmetsp:Transcript_32297/g.55864  ORF Transcript_32297/g.55864 Transcript_32297/m.55864 type:complete len:191 (-) Transcript_32297:33-605(-)